jgi:hypothetical protein
MGAKHRLDGDLTERFRIKTANELGLKLPATLLGRRRGDQIEAPTSVVDAVDGSSTGT